MSYYYIVCNRTTYKNHVVWLYSSGYGDFSIKFKKLGTERKETDSYFYKYEKDYINQKNIQVRCNNNAWVDIVSYNQALAYVKNYYLAKKGL
jgi:hypothetical protein